jgi:plasmid stability protein
MRVLDLEPDQGAGPKANSVSVSRSARALRAVSVDAPSMAQAILLRCRRNAGIRGQAMGQLTVRKVDDEIIRRLKIRAAEHGRSAEAEHREILKQALLPETSAEDFWALADRLRKEGPRMPGDSADIIRHMRDEQ